jgi:hypothetical protein
MYKNVTYKLLDDIQYDKPRESKRFYELWEKRKDERKINFWKKNKKMTKSSSSRKKRKIIKSKLKLMGNLTLPMVPSSACSPFW